MTVVGEKVVTPAEAVRSFVKPGDWLHLAYGGARPNALVAEIVRQFHGTRPDFRVSAQGFVNSQHALIAAGLVSHLCVAFAGENYPAPRPNPVLQRALAGGELTVENWSIWSLTARLIAGALGVDGLPVRSLARSGIAAENTPERFQAATSPEHGEGGVVRALRPDVVLVHGIAADREGNVLLPAPYGEGNWGALAARTGVLASVETIVDADVLRDFNTQPIIPGHVVRAVSCVPRGSHPYGLWPGSFPGVSTYAEDGRFMAELRAAARSPESFEAWIREWILDLEDHDVFLAKLDARVPEPVRANRSASVVTAAGPASGPASDNERMTIAAARLIDRRVRERGHDSVLAGIGFAHLAAWTAAGWLAQHGVNVELLAELGMAGVRPLPGDPYLFASQNLAGCARLTDVASVLGASVAGSAGSTLAVLGAGEVDAHGNLNSTWSADGRFLVGSGGANDVASAADEVLVVVRQGAERLVPEVNYVTAPGHRVSTIVTTDAIFERTDGHFVVTGWLLDPNVGPEAMREWLAPRTGWELFLADEIVTFDAPSRAELTALRAFDPDRVFLKG